MSSSELNDFVLNTDRVVRLGQIVLDVRALNTSVVGGKSAYDAIDLTYNSTVSTYDGTLTSFATGSSSFGGLTATVQSTPVVIATATAQLGAMTSTAQATVTHFATGNILISGLEASALSNISNIVSATAQLGELTSTASAGVTHNVIATSELGILNATANTLPIILPLFTADLNGLNVTATSSVTDLVGATAELGALLATANATVIPKPQPEAQGQYGSNRPYAKPQRKVEPAPLPEPPVIEIIKTEPARPVRMPATIVANANPINVTPTISAQSQIEWSILDDEAELLLLL